MGRVARVAEQDASRVGGRYRLVEKLGTGGMSVVWRGYDDILGRQVAVKVLSPRLADEQSFRERLRQEALSAARLSHPHITGIFDFGEAALGGRLTVPYVVMELNDGESVSRRLSRRGPLPWREAVTVAAEVASALATAHARGVVHRDVTPANVMLTGAGAKVVDFGISALIGEQDAAPDGSLLGTPAYLAPERLGGGHVLPATDVYALGLLLYRCLTARLPWPAQTTTDALRAHLYADPEPLPTLPGMPARVAQLCLRCLAKDPTDRPTAAELAYALAAVVGLQAVIPPLPATDADQPSPAWSAATEPGHGGRRTIRPTWLSRPATARVLRLRAELRLGAALRVGSARPLGGGLFAGGQVGHDLRTGGALGRALVAGRHRVQAAAATLGLIAVFGVGWAVSDEPAPTGPAQAAAAGGAAPLGLLQTVDCQVRYQVRRDSGAAFEAALTVTNTGERAVTGGRVEFVFPGTQRLSAAVGVITQRGRYVVVRAGTLRPGRPVGVTLRGNYRDTNPLPLAFTVARQPCRAEVLGTTVADQSPATGDADGTTEVSDAADPAQRVAGSAQNSRGGTAAGESTGGRAGTAKLKKSGGTDAADAGSAPGHSRSISRGAEDSAGPTDQPRADRSRADRSGADRSRADRSRADRSRGPERRGRQHAGHSGDRSDQAPGRSKKSPGRRGKHASGGGDRAGATSV